MQYSKTSTYKICTKLDFPPVSSAIIWARQVHTLCVCGCVGGGCIVLVVLRLLLEASRYYMYMYLTHTHTTPYLTHAHPPHLTSHTHTHQTSHTPHLTHTQIDRQLQTYLQRVEAVLGAGWEKHVEGQRLKEDGDSFRQKLNTQPLFDDWRKKVCGV